MGQRRRARRKATGPAREAGGDRISVASRRGDQLAGSVAHLGDVPGFARPTEILAVPSSASIAWKLVAGHSTECT